MLNFLYVQRNQAVANYGNYMPRHYTVQHQGNNLIVHLLDPAKNASIALYVTPPRNPFAKEQILGMLAKGMEYFGISYIAEIPATTVTEPGKAKLIRMNPRSSKTSEGPAAS